MLSVGRVSIGRVSEFRVRVRVSVSASFLVLRLMSSVDMKHNYVRACVHVCVRSITLEQNDL